MDVRVSFAQFDPLGTPVDVRVGWCQFDPLGAPVDVRVGWCQFDPAFTVVAVGAASSPSGSPGKVRTYKRNYGGGLVLSPWMLLGDSGGSSAETGDATETVVYIDSQPVAPAPSGTSVERTVRAVYPTEGHLQQYLTAKSAAEARYQSTAASQALVAENTEDTDMMMFMAMLALMEE